jgi:hypothetical protein
MAARGREAQRLGRALRDEPKSFPGEILDIFRRSFRTVWRARGGGFYATGVFVTFVMLEIRMLFSDIVEAESVGDFFTEQLWEMFFRYFSESFINGFLALIWPVYVLEWRQPYGILLLAGLYVIFAAFLKQPLGRWLFDGAVDDPE